MRHDERGWVRERIVERRGSDEVVAHGVVYEPSFLPGFEAEDDGRRVGLPTYQVEDEECEIVTIDAFEEGVASAPHRSARRRRWAIGACG
jgi:hypothetical protein